MLLFLLLTGLFARLNLHRDSNVSKESKLSMLSKGSNITYSSCDALINNIQRPTDKHICACNVVEGAQSCVYELKERRLQGEGSNVSTNGATNNTVHDPNNPNCNCPDCQNKNAGGVQTAGANGQCANPNCQCNKNGSCQCGPNCKCGVNGVQTAGANGKCTNPNCQCTKNGGTCQCGKNCGNGKCKCGPNGAAPVQPLAGNTTVQQLSGANSSFNLVGQNEAQFVSGSKVSSVIAFVVMLF